MILCLLSSDLRGSSRPNQLSLPDSGSPSPPDSPPDDMEMPENFNKYARRRSRAVLYTLSGTYGQKNSKSKIQLNKVIINC